MKNMVHRFEPLMYLTTVLIWSTCILFQSTQKWMTEDKKLSKMTDEVDYDVEGT
jgi:hypothetical protein